MPARVYLITGFIPQSRVIFSFPPGRDSVVERQRAYEQRGMSPPANFRILSLQSSKVVLGVAYYDFNRGVIYIRASRRSDAYSLADSLLGVLSLAYGYEQEASSGEYSLNELNSIPQPDWTPARLLGALRARNPDASDSTISALRTGYGLEPDRLEELQRFLLPVHRIPPLRRALAHFRRSRQIFYGFMTGSYYHSHYRHDRSRMRGTDVEKEYLEFGTRFELAFIAGFKALEHLLSSPFLKEKDIQSALARSTYLGLTPDSPYERRHEIFRGMKARATIAEMVSHFLRVRNASAAHGNSAPPAPLMVSEDSVYEIQLFISFLVWSAIERDPSPDGGRLYRVPDTVRAT